MRAGHELHRDAGAGLRCEVPRRSLRGKIDPARDHTAAQVDEHRHLLEAQHVPAEQNVAAPGGSALTIGEYLSPRLYLSYGVGLFEPGQVVTLRYRVSSKVSLEASQGPLNQKAGINYRIEK